MCGRVYAYSSCEQVNRRSTKQKLKKGARIRLETAGQRGQEKVEVLRCESYKNKQKKKTKRKKSE